ncbi:MAG: AAA family ATPase [Cyanobacteria bacterium J06627_32]
MDAFSAAGEPEVEPRTKRQTSTFDVASAIQHCSERESVLRRAKLERFAFEHQLGQQSFDYLQQAINESAELVRIDEKRMTTQSAIRLELEAIRLMQAGRGKAKALFSADEIELLLSKCSLTDEQQQAVALALTTSDQVIAWQGSAGVGKTYALSMLKRFVEEKGIQVRGFAPSAEAAHTLGESLKIETGTVAGLLGNFHRRKYHQIGLMRMSHFGREGLRSNRASTGSICCLVSAIPL